jgi:hypothetical protein
MYESCGYKNPNEETVLFRANSFLRLFEKDGFFY